MYTKKEQQKTLITMTTLILPVPNNFLLIFYLRIKNTNILKMAVTFH